MFLSLLLLLLFLILFSFNQFQCYTENEEKPYWRQILGINGSSNDDHKDDSD